LNEGSKQLFSFVYHHFGGFLSEACWALTNVVNTSSSYCISPRIRDRLLVSFLEHITLYFSPIDTTSPFESSSSFAIIAVKIHEILIVILPLYFFLILEPKTKANQSKESKKTLRTEN
jgi:hypothetical protein